MREGEFTLTPDTPLHAADREGASAAAWLRDRLATGTGLRLPDRGDRSDESSDETRPGITVRGAADGLPPEGYRLRVDAEGVRIDAGGPAGAFYGAQTLAALLPPGVWRRAPVGSGPWRLPYAEIEDAPRHAWRGVLLDVARHFLPVREVLRWIDLLALHRLNVLHLHLSDDQGWRVEVRGRPELTAVGGWRRSSPVGHHALGRADGRPHGGWYSQDDLREIVAHAAARHVTVVPEIDVPGHVGAALAAYPELGNTDLPDRAAGAGRDVACSWGVFEDVLNVEESTRDFFGDVLDQLMDVFPGPWFGIGGDECPAGQWERSPRARARMAELGITDPAGVRAWYAAGLAERLAARGRRALVWDELCDAGLPPGAVVASWRGRDGARTAVRRGHDAVLCPEGEVYLDYRQSDDPAEPTPVGTLTSLARVHAFRAHLDPDGPPGDGPEPGRVLGAQCALWSEYADSPRALDYLAFPRVCAFAEAVWGTAADGGHAGFLARLAVHERRLDALGVEYRPAGGPHPWQTRPDAPGRPR
jgi:hexosaminidase